MKTNGFKPIDLSSFGLEILNARTSSTPGFECIEMLIFNALFFQKSLFYKLVSLPILFNAVLLNTKLRTVFNTQSIRDKNINIISKIALSLGISIFAIYKQRPVLGALASILVMRAFNIFPIFAALGLKQNRGGSETFSRFSCIDQNASQGGVGFAAPPRNLEPTGAHARQPSPQGGVGFAAPLSDLEVTREHARQPSPQSELRFAAPPRNLEVTREHARQPSPQVGLGFAAPLSDLEVTRAHARQPSPQGGLGFAALPSDLEVTRAHARQPSPQGGLGFAAPLSDLEVNREHARQPSPQGGMGFAALPGNRDFQQTQAIGQAFLGPNIGFTPQSSAVNEQPLQRQNRASSFYPPLDQHSFQPNRQNVDFAPIVTRGHGPRRGGAQEELRQRNIPFNGRVSAEGNRQ